MIEKVSTLICFILFFSLNITAQVSGCTDPLANNYNPSATNNDGSCTYNAATVSPTSTQNMSSTLDESSGLITWNNTLWTHNDNSDVMLYAIDTITGAIISSYIMSNVVNNDWEEISQDTNFVYIGDFGNNGNGNRTDLKILRINKSSILNNQPVIDTLNFTYSDQVNFTPTGGNNTDFDCEAFVVSSDSIYLFTKQWVTNGTKVYAMPKLPGTHVANYQSTFDVQGLITGATFMEEQRLIVLSGYSSLLQPFIYCLYDYDSTNFFSGNKQKIGLSLPFHQVEGIATDNGRKYYLTNEYFTQPPIITTQQKLHIIGLDNYLAGYLNSLTSSVAESVVPSKPEIFPNPANDNINIRTLPFSEALDFVLSDVSGRAVLSGQLEAGLNSINTNEISPGIYFLRLGTYNYQIIINH